ncbi:MAG TPA: hypothetical protein VF041_23010 [Gemmatimonadaceae bacterium]
MSAATETTNPAATQSEDERYQAALAAVNAATSDDTDAPSRPDGQPAPDATTERSAEPEAPDAAPREGAEPAPPKGKAAAKGQEEPDWRRQYEGLQGTFQQTRSQAEQARQEAERLRADLKARDEAEDARYREAIAQATDPVAKEYLQTLLNNRVAERTHAEEAATLRAENERLRAMTQQAERERAAATKAQTYQSLATWPDQYAKDLGLEPDDYADITAALDDPLVRQAFAEAARPEDLMRTFLHYGQWAEKALTARHEQKIKANREEARRSGAHRRESGAGAAGAAPADPTKFRSTPTNPGDHYDDALKAVNEQFAAAQRG